MHNLELNIVCYLSSGCASEDQLRENINTALAKEDLIAEVSFLRIDDDQALELGLTGSPSILINGEELQPTKGTGFS
ncbi:MAG: thioredoxin family protein [Actinobacteria bacterium]|nr:thioredoxin family protein [Actinomycetota bacterium]